MSEFPIWLAVVAVGAVLLTWALRREFARLDEQRRREEALREWLATNPLALKLKRDFEAVSRQIGEALIPALTQMTAAFTTWANDPKTKDAMKRISELTKEGK